MRKFYSRILLTCTLFLTVLLGHAQITADLYSFSTSTGATLDPMTGALTATPSGNDDDPSALLNIGFTFRFESTDYTQFSITPDGFIKLGTPVAVSQFTNSISSTTNIPKLFPFWDDHATGSDGYVKYLVTGTSPNRILKVEWFVTIPRNTTGPATTKFQAWLYETTNVIEFRYGGTPGTISNGASIGIRGAQNSATAGQFKFHSVNPATHTSSTTTTNDSYLTYPGVGRMYTFTPPPPCIGAPNPGTISGTAQTCTGNSVDLTINGSTIASGLNYQWASSTTSGGPYTPIAGATAINFNTGPLSQTTYYIATVSCGTNNSNTPQFTVTVPPAFPAGDYTINSINPASATNFQSFTAAVAAISCGIAGPVTFTVTGGGPYTEQISIPQVGGASATSRVTFIGNNNTIQAVPVTGTRYIIQLNGADFITFKKLNIVSQSGATFGWGVHLTNGANNNIIDSCTINISTVTSTTQSNSAGIVASGSTTSVTTGGSASNNRFSNNEINGAYQGVIIYGTATAVGAVSDSIINNNIHDFYAYGIVLSNASGAYVVGNDINRATRGTVGTFEGIEMGTNTRNSLVMNNRIHDTHTANLTGTGTAYGIFTFGDAPAGSENRYINNAIYNFNSLSGTQYGLYNSDADGQHYYHNTVTLDRASSTGGDARGFYQTTTAINVRFRNNIVSITRGGTGQKVAIYLASTTSTVTSNNNDLWVNAPGTAGFVGVYGSTTYSTLANWQTANSGAYDQQSVSEDPNFSDAATGNLYPNNTGLMGVGAPLGVTADIVGTPRSATAPTPGAYEIVLAAGVDVGVKQLLLPTQTACYSGPQTVKVTIINYSASTHNFATTPVTINVAVTGPNATTFPAVVVNTGTLASQDTLDVVITTNYSMSSAGTYTFTGITSATGDVNLLNNDMPQVTLTVKPLEAGTASSSPGGYCQTGGIPKLTTAGSSGGILQWQVSTSGLPGSWTNVGTNDTTYTPSAAIPATRYYRAYAVCGTNSDTTNTVQVAVSTPQLVSSVPGSRCGPGTVILSATPSTGATVNWYAAATGGNPVATGNIFTTPIINSTTTYYASVIEGSTQSTVGLSPTATNCGTIASSTATDWPLRFDITKPVTINSVWVIPSTTGTFTIALRESLQTTDLQSISMSFTSAQLGVPQQINLGWSVSTPGSYQLTNVVGGIYRIGTFTCTYPFTSALGGFSIVGSATFSNSATTDFQYNSFYNISVTEGCETARTPVQATVTPAPAFNITDTTSVCNGAIRALAVTTPAGNFNTYTWTPATNLFTDNTAVIPYNAGSSATTVYVKTTTPGTYNYIVTANNTSTGCQNFDSVKVTVLPATATVSGLPSQVCVSGPVALALNPAAGYGNSTFQWFSSPDGTNFTAITGANTSTFTTPAINSNTTYRLRVNDNLGNTCYQPQVAIQVNNPQVLTTTPGALCGTGPVTLGATSSTGATLAWFTAATGGSPVATGPSFTTPSLSTNTTYYVAAQVPSGSGTVTVGAGNSTSSSYESPYYHLWGGKRSQYLIRAEDLYAANMTAGNISSVAFDVVSAGITYNNFRISMKHTTAPAMTNTLETGFTTVYPATSVTPTVGINTYAFGTPFNWNGTSNIIVEVCWSNNNTGGTSASVRMDATTYVSHAYYRNDNENDIVVCGTTAATATQSLRPKMIFNAPTSCFSPRTAVVATVNAATVITAQPSSQATCAGSNVVLSVTANGANLTYQWRKNGVNIAGATSSSYAINGSTVADAGNYDVVITGLCGSQTSASVTLTVAASNSWLGATSNDWNTPSNWCGGVPTSTSDVVITAGTPFQPTLNAVGEVRNLTISTGASMTITPNGFLNSYGNYTNLGTFNGTGGVIAFKGTANQSIGAINAGTVLINGAGITLAGDMSVAGSLILTNGHITLGANNLTLNNSVNGSAASHVITNGTGDVITNNVTTSAVTVPVGPDAANYNPVIISNGGGRNYAVSVVTGIVPSGILNPARAINRTWNVIPNTAPAGNVNIIYQYEDDDVNASASPTLVMEVGYHNGTQWSVISPALGVTPSGTTTSRQVGITTNQFGPMVVANIGGLTNPLATPNVDGDVTRVLLMPNITEGSTVLRTHLRRAMKINWMVIDANGRVVMTFGKQFMAGQTDTRLDLSRLAGGSYILIGLTEKGKTPQVRFIRQ